MEKFPEWVKTKEDYERWKKGENPPDKKCPSCAMMIPKEADICPHCRKKQGTSVIVKIALIIFVLMGIGMCQAIIDNKGTENISAPKTDADLSGDAAIMSEKFVTKALKAPSTAKFPYFKDASVTKTGANQFKVESYVDSQNSFGAMIRTNYSCELKYMGSNRWQLVDLKFF